MALGSGLVHLAGHRFDVRYSAGALDRARAVAAVAEDAYGSLDRLLAGVTPDIALLVVGEADWESRQPYGLPFFTDGDGDLRPALVVMPAGSGDFWVSIAEDLREASPTGFARLAATYPDGSGGVDLQPFFDLVTIHELGHAFEVLGDVRLPTFWLSEIFANLALHAFVATRRPELLDTLEVLSIVGSTSRRLAARWRAEGYTTLEDLEAHYTGGDQPMSALNYVWYQCRWQRLAARVFAADGEMALVRLWNCFRGVDRFPPGTITTASVAGLLRREVSETLGVAIQRWR